MEAFVAVVVTCALIFIAGSVFVYLGHSVRKAQRYAITLVNNEGSFVALCTERRWDRWVFEDVRLTPSNPGGPVQHAAPGKLYVPKRNILYYQEIQEIANVAE